MLVRLFQFFNNLITSKQLASAKWLAIAHPMSLGDVVACFPVAGMLKEKYPELKICFIGVTYTKPLVNCCEHIDRFLVYEEVKANPNLLRELGVDIFLNPFPEREMAVAASKARIPVRVGNLRRWKVIAYCNRFMMVKRRNSGRHVIQLNLECLVGLGLRPIKDLKSIYRYYGMTKLTELSPEIACHLTQHGKNIIFHPKSNKHAREWPAKHFTALAHSMAQNDQIFITGTASEGEQLKAEEPALFASDNVIDLCGKLDLTQLIAFVSRVDGLVASSTGPLHIAAALGINTLGIFPPREEMNPVHWAPVGRKAEFLCLDVPCKPGDNRCPDDFNGGPCACTEAISPQSVKSRIDNWNSL